VGPPTSLDRLTRLYLQFNDISDLGPLVANTRIHSGDVHYLNDNPLDCTVFRLWCVNDLEEAPRFDPATLGGRLPGLQDHLRSLPEIETRRLSTSVHRMGEGQEAAHR